MELSLKMTLELQSSTAFKVALLGGLSNLDKIAADPSLFVQIDHWPIDGLQYIRMPSKLFDKLGNA